jgi:hypothetical protein
MGFGIHGPYLFVDRQCRIVIAKASSQELPLDAERIKLTMHAVSCIRDWPNLRSTVALD